MHSELPKMAYTIADESANIVISSLRTIEMKKHDK
jgi:hypothetical protein